MNTLQEAVGCIEQGRTEEGLQLLKQVTDHGTDEEKYEAARYYHTLGFLEQALVIMEDLSTLYPEESELTLFLAELYLDFDREDEAIEILNDIKRDDDLYVQGLLLLADLYQAQGLDEVAEQKLLLAHEELPDEPIILFGLGEFYSSQGDFVKAVPYYEELLTEQNEIGGVSIPLRLAEALSSLGQWEEAIPYYERGLESHKDIHTLFGHAFTLYQAGMYQRAIPVFLELKELDPHYTSLHEYLADCYEEEGMMQECYDTLKEGLKTDSYSVGYHIKLAEAAARLGFMDEAQTALLEALALDPGHLEAVLKYIHILKHDEKYEEIITAITIAMENGEDDPQLTWDLAFAKKQLEQYSDALNHYREAYTSFKDNFTFLEEYGHFLLEEGLRQEARDVFKRLLDLDPTQTHIEELLFNLEDFQ
ncbi:tetratricopeptide repeat protein [Ectobacillus polymachus]|uniref:tetratricopeptide repeat protein n=1 Tax=Ectobacillus polymachus TaxID=1508806 RepID=UPI003A8375F5